MKVLKTIVLRHKDYLILHNALIQAANGTKLTTTIEQFGIIYERTNISSIYQHVEKDCIIFKVVDDKKWVCTRLRFGI